MYKTSSGQSLKLGKELGKGGAANVYIHGTDKSKAIKIFKPQILQKEINLAKRIEKLNQLSQIADIEIPFGGAKKTIGAWPKDIVLDASDGLMASFGLGGIPPKIVLLGIAI